MALQVGNFCYATPADAGVAACSSFEAETSIQGTHLISATCYGTNPVTGALYIRMADTDTVANTTVFTVTSHLQSFPPCTNADYLEFMQVIFGGILTVWFVWWCGKKVINAINTGRGDYV